jgi:hypothetical protein
MMLREMLQTLVANGAVRPAGVNDYTTSLNYLSRALGYASLDVCPVDDICRLGETWLKALEAHFAALTAQGTPKSSKTRSNTRNHIRVIFRAAAAQGLIVAPPPLPALVKPQLRETFKAQQLATAPYRSSYHPTTSPRRYGLPKREWPPECQAGWERYLARCDIRIRKIRHKNNVDTLSLYFGYFANILGREPRCEDLFDREQLQAFVRWHADRLERQPLSAVGWQVVIVAATIAKVLEHKSAKDLAEWRNKLGDPEPVHDKDLHWVSLAELNQVADAWLEDGRMPVPKDRRNRHHGARLAGRFQKGVILKLLVQRPMRIRNIRELQLGKNLYQDQAKHWQLRFRGKELKVGMRGASANEYKIDLTQHRPTFIPVLEEFLRDYRPRLPGAETSSYLFLNHQGRPFSENLGKELKMAVGLKTGKRWFPHMIRSVWPTEYIRKKKDFAGAAEALGNRQMTVIKNYQHIPLEELHEEGNDFLSKTL